MVLLLGISAGFPGIRGYGVERCNDVHQAPQALEGVVGLRAFSHLNTSTLSSTSWVPVLSSAGPPAVSPDPCRLGDAEAL